MWANGAHVDLTVLHGLSSPKWIGRRAGTLHADTEWASNYSFISPFFTILLKQTASNSWALYDKVVISADSQQQIYWPLRCTETIFSLIWQVRYFIKTVFQQFWITAATPFCQKQTKDVFHQRRGNQTQRCSMSWNGEHPSCSVKNGGKKKGRFSDSSDKLLNNWTWKWGSLFGRKINKYGKLLVEDFQWTSKWVGLVFWRLEAIWLHLKISL